MKYPLRVHAIALSDDDGGRAATLTATQLARSLVRVNAVYRVADIEFVFDAETDWEPMRDTWLNTMNRGDTDWPRRPNEIAERYPGKVVMFFRFGERAAPSGNGNAYPPDIGRPIPPSWSNESTDVDFVTLPSTRALLDQDSSFFSHELGHYLGLYHTFPFTGDDQILTMHMEPGDTDTDTLTAARAEELLVRFVRANGGTAAALDGDLLADTSPDPGTLFWTRHGHDNCRGEATVRLTGTLDGRPYDLSFTPPRSNVMSYYACASATFTPAQIERMHATLVHPARNHLLPHLDLGVNFEGPAAIDHGPNAIHVFARGDDRSIWHNYWTTDFGWNGWTNDIGVGTFSSGPAATIHGPNAIHVFARGDDRSIWHNYWTTDFGWNGWTNDIGAGTFSSGPAATIHGPNAIHVFARGDDRSIWHNYWTTDFGWNGWTNDIGAGTFS